MLSIFKKRYLDGWSVVESVQDLDISEYEICSCIENLTDDELATHINNLNTHIIELYNSGYSVSQIIRKTSISRPRVKSILEGSD